MKDIDKDSVEYFMTKMTQEEFTERCSHKEKKSHSFNIIQNKFINQEEFVYIPPNNSKPIAQNKLDEWWNKYKNMKFLEMQNL